MLQLIPSRSAGEENTKNDRKAQVCASAIDKSQHSLAKRKLVGDQFDISSMSRCNRCCKWDMKTNSNAICKIKIPKNYPSKSDSVSPPEFKGRSVAEKFLIPIQSTFHWLISVFKFAAHNVRVSVWIQGVMIANLRW